MKVAILTESPDDSVRTWDTIREIAEPLEEEYKGVRRFSCLASDPRNGKQATKTELRECVDRVRDDLARFDLVILVGNTPLQAITGKAGIASKRGRPFEQGGKIYLPMNNPSIIRHDPLQRTVLEADLKLVHDIIAFGGVPEETEIRRRLVLTWEDVDEMIEDLSGTVSCDLETDSDNKDMGGLYPWAEGACIVTIGFGTERNQWILPVTHPQSPWEFAEVEEMVDRITVALEDCIMVYHNGKFDLLWMWVIFGVEWDIDFDTMLAHYMYDENMRHGLKYIAQLYCGAPDWEMDKDEKRGMRQVPLDKIAKYHAHDLYYTRALRFILGKMLAADPEVKRVFDKIMMPCSRLFVEVEMNGVYIDESKFDDAEKYLRGEYNKALAELKEWEPEYSVNAKGKKVPFNWGSTKQLANLLFGKKREGGLGLEVVEYTAAGNASCSESVIKRIDHPCTGALLKFRGAKQQLSFFIDGWKPYLHRWPNGDVYLHPSFKLHGTVTGRLSCEHPNLQQVPRDKRIRSLITAPEGWTLLECDLSQIELRIAAELANERNMLHAFASGIDTHWLTAIREIERGGGYKDLVLDTARTWKQDKKLNYSESIAILLEMGPDAAKEIDERWGEIRKKAKAINFGYLYGMWWKKFKIYARDNYGVTVTDEESQASRIGFFQLYPDFDPWHDRQRRYARKNGYVKSLSGRKRRLPEARKAEDSPERREAERQAINSPVQSFANELNLMAAIQLRKEFGRNVIRICGTVHDAILVRVRNDMLEKVHDRLLEIMSHPELMDDFGIDIFVPIEAEGKVGPWGAGVSLKKWKEAQRGQKANHH